MKTLDVLVNSFVNCLYLGISDAEKWWVVVPKVVEVKKSVEESKKLDPISKKLDPISKNQEQEIQKAKEDLVKQIAEVRQKLKSVNNTEYEKKLADYELKLTNLSNLPKAKIDLTTLAQLNSIKNDVEKINSEQKNDYKEQSWYNLLEAEKKGEIDGLIKERDKSLSLLWVKKGELSKLLNISNKDKNKDKLVNPDELNNAWTFDELKSIIESQITDINEEISSTEKEIELNTLITFEWKKITEKQRREELFKKSEKQLNSGEKALKVVDYKDSKSKAVNDVLENKTLETYTSWEILMMKQESYDLSQLFLISKDWNVSKDSIIASSTLIVNFWKNKNLDHNIWAWDLLPMDRIYEIEVNWQKWTRKYEPRPWYYTKDGEYLDIHNWDKIKITEEKPFEEKEDEIYKESTLKRYKSVRWDDIMDYLISNKGSKDIKIPFSSKMDIELLMEKINTEFPENKEDIKYNKETWNISIKESANLGDIMGKIWKYQELKDLLKDPAFSTRLDQVCSNIWARKEDLIKVIIAESWWNPRARNKISGASWLIQFMPKTAIWLWTTTEELRWMWWLKQLDYVEKYFKKNSWWHNLNDITKLYQSVFFPASLWKPKDWIFQAKGISSAKVSAQNPVISKFSPNKIIDWYCFEKYVLDHVSKIA